MEIFPTCIRQSGVGFCSFVSQIISIGGPYVIALGSTNVVVSNSIQGLIIEAYFFCQRDNSVDSPASYIISSASMSVGRVLRPYQPMSGSARYLLRGVFKGWGEGGFIPFNKKGRKK